MLSILKRLPVLPQRLHVTGEPRTWFAFPLPAPLPPSGSSADPESAPGGGGGGASGVGDPAVSGAGGVAAAGLRCAARIALARPASFCAFVLRVMPDEKPGSGGEGASRAPAAREAVDRPDERPLRAPYAVLHASRIMTRAPWSTKVAAADPELITGGFCFCFSEQVPLAERTLPPRPTASPSPRTAHRTGTAVRGRTGRSFRLPVQRPRRKKCGLRAGEGPLTDGATYES